MKAGRYGNNFLVSELAGIYRQVGVNARSGQAVVSVEQGRKDFGQGKNVTDDATGWNYRRCPAKSVLVGIKGRRGDFQDALGGICRKIVPVGQ